MFITDGLQAYKNIAKRVGYNLVHVQCIHQPPYNRVNIDQIHDKGNKIFTTTLATCDDILNGKNAFVVQESNRVETKV